MSCAQILLVFFKGAPLVPWTLVGETSGPVVALPIPYDWPLTPYRKAPAVDAGQELG